MYIFLLLLSQEGFDVDVDVDVLSVAFFFCKISGSFRGGVKKEEMTKRIIAGRTSKTKPCLKVWIGLATAVELNLIKSSEE